MKKSSFFLRLSFLSLVLFGFVACPGADKAYDKNQADDETVNADQSDCLKNKYLTVDCVDEEMNKNP